MIQRNLPINSLGISQGPVGRLEAGQNPSLTELQRPSITVFAVPKPFGGSVDHIQRNAIRSWSRLGPHVEVLLIGDEAGIKDVAEEFGVRHAGGLKANRLGTPLLSSAFEIAHQCSTSPILVYCNSDVILLEEFVRSIERLEASELAEFVAFGRRADLVVKDEVAFEDKSTVEKLAAHSRRRRKASSIVCKEYFAFSRSLYQAIPEFAVGRGNWDNWMIHSAKQIPVPVVDISPSVAVVHQAHDYSHIGKGRWSCYVAGEEARENQRLAGGRHLISGSTGTWRLHPDGIRKVRLKRLHLSFWSDLPRFLRLMMNLMLNR